MIWKRVFCRARIRSSFPAISLLPIEGTTLVQYVLPRLSIGIIGHRSGPWYPDTIQAIISANA